MKNTGVNSVLGAIGGGSGAVTATLCLTLWHSTGNQGYLWLLLITCTILSTVLLLAANTYIRVKLEQQRQAVSTHTLENNFQ